jgi:hypothetical protein
MAATGSNGQIKTFSSSPELSSPPSDSLSDPEGLTRLEQGRANIAQMGDEIIVDTAAGARFSLMKQQQSGQPPLQPPYPEGTRLTKDGVPRKKPGRKPGTTIKKPTDSTEAPKQRKPRKPRDPNAPPIVRKRKVPPTEDESERSTFATPPERQPKITELTSMRMDIDSRPPPPRQPVYAEPAPKQESLPRSMQSILNADPPPPSASAPAPAPHRSSGQSYDPIRSSTYDPVRETMLARDPYGTGPLGSPRAPAPMTNRASASPSIASLVDPPVSSLRSPASQQTYSTSQPRYHDSGSLPPSPSNAIRSVSQAAAKVSTAEVKRPPPPPPAPTKTSEPAKPAAPTTTFKDINMSGSGPAPTKKVASMVQQERKQQKNSSATSSPKIAGVKDNMLPVPEMPASGNEKSILDFGKVKTGDESSAPTIVLHIPLNGETNKYVNFMRLAEERYGWDALHPRLAASRDRKARIAAATAALEKAGSGRESGDEMSVDLQSGDEGSNGEGANGGGGTSGADGQPTAKPARKKRNFKEDEYDKDDDFVDDSELLWEEQAAASRDGFFVYSGPLIPEVEKPAPGYVAPTFIAVSLSIFIANFTQNRRPPQARPGWTGTRRYHTRRWHRSWSRRRSRFSRRLCDSQTAHDQTRKGAARSREAGARACSAGDVQDAQREQHRSGDKPLVERHGCRCIVALGSALPKIGAERYT